VWVNTNWLVLQGLRGIGADDLAAAIRRQTIQLVNHHGFREYFDPFTGEGYGTDSFSWTAALVIDMLHSPV